MFEKYIHEDLEQALLSRFIDNPQRIFNCPDLKKEHFLIDIHRKMYEAIIDSVNRLIPVNPKNIADRVNDKEKTEYIIKVATLSAIIDEKSVGNYIIDESDKYNVLVKASELIEQAKEDKDVDIYATLSDLSMKRQKFDDEISVEKMLKELEKKMSGEELGILTKIDGIDDYINGLQKGRLYVVGARPSMGKSAFMCSIIENIEREHKVGVLSLEMNKGELLQRIACLRAKIKHWIIEKGKCNGEQFDRYAKELWGIKNTLINDKGGLNKSQVVSIIRGMVKKAKCEVIFIDHLGLIKTETKSNGNLAHEVGLITSTLKALSKELEIPIVCLCQLNRGIEQEKVKKPRMSDIRESGRIEEDADCVILLYRDSYYDKNATEQAEYIIGKCRNGKTGVVTGLFEQEMMKWS